MHTNNFALTSISKHSYCNGSVRFRCFNWSEYSKWLHPKYGEKVWSDEFTKEAGDKIFYCTACLEKLFQRVFLFQILIIDISYRERSFFIFLIKAEVFYFKTAHVQRQNFHDMTFTM
jgi:hypothetical protein